MASARHTFLAWPIFAAACGGADPPPPAAPVTKPPVPASSSTPAPALPATVPIGKPDEQTLTPDVVTQRITRVYMGELRRCQRDALVKDPAARGKVTLAFTVTPDGATAARAVRGFHAGVDACIARRLATWRFPSPGAAPASFQIVLSLETDE